MTSLPTAQVAVPIASIEGALSYQIPARFQGRAVVGVRVRVGVSGRRVVGVITALDDAPDARATRGIEEILDDVPLLLPSQIAVAAFVAQYYQSSLGEAVRLALPPDTGRDIKRRFKITGRGLEAKVFTAAHGLTAADAAALTAFVDDDTWLDESTLRRAGASKKRLTALVDGGFLEASDKRTAAGPREDPLVCARDDGAPLPPRAPALAAIDAYVRTHDGDLRRSALEMLFPGARGKVARLVTLGRLELTVRVRPSVKRAASSTVVDDGRALSDAQRTAVDVITARREGATLVEGVTGSGKTEVYLRALKHTLDEGRGAILVVPEIGLTPQLVQRVHAAVKEPVAVLHSGLTTAERRDTLFQVARGEARVVVGARSALFAPVANLGLIVVDEEHDASLKQDEAPRYHGKDVALWRARHEGARIVLGSATPSLESRENAREGKFQYVQMTQRFGGGGTLPDVTVIDLRERKEIQSKRRRDKVEGFDGGAVLSGPLQDAIAETLAAGEQVLLFLNRRGFASVLLCTSCGEVAECPHCSVSMTVHKERGRLICHQCDHEEAVKTACKTCAGAMLAVGVGTEKVEEVVSALFPEARTARLDRDTVKGRGAFEAVLKRVQKREIDILIGTQMVAKGHDFPGIALVGVVLADTALAIPDFRASERAFQLLTQVAGRAGRGDTKGRVFVQTFQPDHPAIQFSKTHDVEGFLAEEREIRLALRYPPFSKIAVVRVDGEDPVAVDAMARRLALAIRTHGATTSLGGAWEVLGPAPAPIERLRGRTRHQILVRADSAKLRHAVLAPIRHDVHVNALKRAGCRLTLDIDPVSML